MRQDYTENQTNKVTRTFLSLFLVGFGPILTLFMSIWSTLQENRPSSWSAIPSQVKKVALLLPLPSPQRSFSALSIAALARQI